MKQNGNDTTIGGYYLGLDVGTGSVGWAVTDKEYCIPKFKGNAMWGVRLFDEAKDAAERRSSRTSRRRLARRKQRLLLLELLFKEEISKVDPNFFVRLQESSLWADDKSSDSRYALFNDKNYTDADYFKTYPTIYHLRTELLHSTAKHDVRLVFLAIHHIMKNRGHFLFAGTDDMGEAATVDFTLDSSESYLSGNFNLELEISDRAAFKSALIQNSIGVGAKKKLLRKAVAFKTGEADDVNLSAAVDTLAGATVKLADLFNDDSLKDAEPKSICLKSGLDDVFDELSEVLGDRIEIILQLQAVYDAARLSQILSGHQSVSEAKVALYEKNKADLGILKKYVRRVAPDKYKYIFTERKDRLNNYAAYSDFPAVSGGYTCTQEEFCKFLSNALPHPNDGDIAAGIFNEISEKTFHTRLRGSDNGVIPYQLQKRELVKILDNASSYLGFLNSADTDGLTVKDKIIKTFEFRLPYYVGPLNANSPRHWAVRFAGAENERVLPWNFDKVIDAESSAAAFIDNLVGRCTYTGEKVLPKDSLLYSEFSLLNELNPMRISGKPIPNDVKKQLIQDLFCDSRKKVTKKRIKAYFLSKGLIEQNEEIEGIDDAVKSSLRSYHDFKTILDSTGDVAMVEGIIRSVLIFGDDKKMLKKWLRKTTRGLSDDDIKHICSLKYSDWGRLSETFLTDIYSPGEWGEAMSIMDCLRNTDYNLMQLLSDNFHFAKNAEDHRNELLGNNQTLTEKLDNLYIAPSVRRSIRQTLRIVDEIVDIKKSLPEKIFIEMARGSKEEMKNKRTERRKDKLIALYRSCGEDSNELFAKLENEDENHLRSDKLYLYYTQLGKCMYTGEPIDIQSLANGEKYDIDHIFPQSRIKDNSLDNRVLVSNKENREKTNIYPIKPEIRSKMAATWLNMRRAGLISEKKYERLIRSSSLTDAELSDFVARQLVETQQSTKALATILKETYGDRVRIVYSKAGNVSDFRHEFGLIKNRDVNDLHHAKDAYLNIVVGNVYCTKFTDKFFSNIQSENYSLNKVFMFDTKGAWEAEKTIVTVKHWMSKNNILVTRMPHEVKGQLYNVQILSAGNGQLSKKNGLDINKYGGYNKVAGAYFCVVEHTDRKKRVRSIEPVFIYKKAMYEKAPEDYCRTVLGLREPIIVAPKILVDSILELDGSRLMITSRSGAAIIYKHCYQLTLSSADEKYLKDVGKYIDRCKAAGRDLPITEHDGISREENEESYDMFLAKLCGTVYEPLLCSFKKDISDGKEAFLAFSESDQCRILMEIVKAFRCDAQYPNFSAFCGKALVARITISKNIFGRKSAYLINQSITGLYERKVDLLAPVSP